MTTTPTEKLSPLEKLKLRTLAHSDDRPAWLQARRPVVTATESKVFLTGTPGAKRKIIADKVSGASQGGVNKYAQWGNKREPAIVEWLGKRFGFTPSGYLYHAEENERHAATPDAESVDFDGNIELGEVKTSRHDMEPGSEEFEKAGYMLQMQWQMYCTGAKRVLFVWEQHDNDWSEWPNAGPKPLHPEPKSQWIERDEAIIKQLVTAANRWLKKLDEALAEAGAAPDEAALAEQEKLDAIIAPLAETVLSERVLEAQHKAAKEVAWKSIQSTLASTPSYTPTNDVFQLSWTAPAEEEVTVPDVAAAQAAQPELWEQLEAKRAELVALEENWARVQAEHTKTDTRTTKASLALTAPKKGK